MKDNIDNVNKWAIYLEKIIAKSKGKNTNNCNTSGTPEKCREIYQNLT